MSFIFWQSLKTAEFAEIDKKDTVIIYPLAAIEQHGPHLPISTDFDIMQAMLSHYKRHFSSNYDVISLPIQQIGYSVEHSKYAGSLSLSPDLLYQICKSISEQVIAYGFNKIIFMSSHGGNSEVAALLSRQLRCEFGILTASTNWLRFLQNYQPKPMDDNNLPFEHDIHGGFAETSLMLYFYEHLVTKENIDAFEINDALIKQRGVSISRPMPIGWAIEDLNEKGVVGRADLANKNFGLQIADHIIDEFTNFIDHFQNSNI